MSEQEVTQTENHVEEAVPHSEIATTVSDMPVDFGDPSAVDFPDAAFGEVVEEDDEVPGSGEPVDDDEDDTPVEEPAEEEADEEADQEPVLPPGVEEEQQEGQQ